MSHLLRYAFVLLAIGGCKERSASILSQEQQAPEEGAAGGSLILIGGGSTSGYWNDIASRFKLLAGGDGHRLGIVSAAARSKAEDLASPDPSGENNAEANGEWWLGIWKNAGFSNVETVPIDMNRKHNTSDPAVIEKIRGMTGFYFSGGDQSRLCSTLYADTARTQRTPAFNAIREAFSRGAVLAGSSSGTAAQSRIIVTAGHSYEAVLHPVAETPESREISGQLSATTGGLGFFPYGIIDTHVNERGRIGRMVKLAAEKGFVNDSGKPDEQRIVYVFAIDEGTGIIVTNSGTSEGNIEVLGSLGVTIIEVDRQAYQELKAQQEQQGKTDFMIKDVKLTFLTHGDRYNPNTHEVTFAPWKKRVVPKTNGGPTTADITSSDVFSNVETSGPGRKPPGELERVAKNFMRHVASETFAESYEKNPTVKLRFHKTPSTVAFAGSAEPEKTVVKTSYKDLLLDMWVERPAGANNATGQ